MTLSIECLVLFVTEGCHLCEEAQAALRAATGHSVAEVDIVNDDALLERYGTRIPVLQATSAGAELDWPFSGDDILSFLRKHHLT